MDKQAVPYRPIRRRAQPDMAYQKMRASMAHRYSTALRLMAVQDTIRIFTTAGIQASHTLKSQAYTLAAEYEYWSHAAATYRTIIKERQNALLGIIEDIAQQRLGNN